MVFCFVQKFFPDNTSQNIYFFCRAKSNFFFQNSTLGYMTKTLNQIMFFSLHPFKLNGRSLMNFWQINMKSQKIPKRYSGRIDKTKKAKKEDKNETKH